MTPLTIESLARALVEVRIKARWNVRRTKFYLEKEGSRQHLVNGWDDLSEELKACFREEARLLFERIMR